MAVRTHLPWWGRGAVLVALLAVIGGMWWWGFDFGQIFGGFNRKEVEARLVTLEADAAKFRAEASGAARAQHRRSNASSRMTRGAQEALDPAGQRALRRERAAQGGARVPAKARVRLEQDVGLQIQRLAVEPDGEDMWRYSLLIVRGGSPKDEFVGNVVLQATVAAARTGDAAQDRSSCPRTSRRPRRR